MVPATYNKLLKIKRKKVDVKVAEMTDHVPESQPVELSVADWSRSPGAELPHAAAFAICWNPLSEQHYCF